MSAEYPIPLLVKTDPRSSHKDSCATCANNLHYRTRGKVWSSSIRWSCEWTNAKILWGWVKTHYVISGVQVYRILVALGEPSQINHPFSTCQKLVSFEIFVLKSRYRDKTTLNRQLMSSTCTEEPSNFERPFSNLAL